MSLLVYRRFSIILIYWTIVSIRFCGFRGVRSVQCITRSNVDVVSVLVNKSKKSFYRMMIKDKNNFPSYHEKHYEEVYVSYTDLVTTQPKMDKRRR